MSLKLTEDVLRWGLSMHHRGDGQPPCYHCDDVHAALLAKDEAITSLRQRAEAAEAEVERLREKLLKRDWLDNPCENRFMFKAGDRVKGAVSGKCGTVQCTQAENPPWHDGGRPFVVGDDGSRCFWYDAVPILVDDAPLAAAKHFAEAVKGCFKTEELEAGDGA